MKRPEPIQWRTGSSSEVTIQGLAKIEIRERREMFITKPEHARELAEWLQHWADWKDWRESRRVD